MDNSTPIADRTLEKPEHILGLLREQSAMYARLESFAARQRALVRSEDTASLLILLSDRQKVAVELARLAARLAPVRRSWPSLRERFSTSQRTEADGLISDVTRRLRGLIESDEKDARVLYLRKPPTPIGGKRGASRMNTGPMGRRSTLARAVKEPDHRIEVC